MSIVNQNKITLFIKGIILSAALSNLCHADIVPSGDSTGVGDGQTPTYLKNLGQYFGFDITQACDNNTCLQKPGGANNFFSTLLDVTKINGIQNEVLITTVRALLPNVNPDSDNSFTNQNSDIGFVNQFANNPFPGLGKTILDQDLKNITDPGDQANINMLTTNTSCIPPIGDKSGTSCQSITADEFLHRMIGELRTDGYPVTGAVVSPEANAEIAKKLNFNRLYNYPILNQDGKNNAGFTLDDALNLVHIITVPYIPLSINANDYTNTYRAAIDDSDKQKQATAKISIYKFLAQVRSLVAQKSVLINNFNQVVANRMPVLKDHNGENTSQAMALLNMASWRLANPSTGDSWRAMIDKASSATVQKENAILLSEINYQLYLMNQNLERILITNSVMAIQNTNTISNNLSFSKESTNDESQSSPDQSQAADDGSEG